MIGQLVASLVMDTKQFKAGIGGATADLKGMVGSVMSIAAPLAGAFGAGAMVSAASEAVSAQRKLEAVIKATGGAAGFTSAQLQKYATDLQSVTNFEDDATVSAMAVLATFKEIKGVTFKDTVASAMDMSSVMETDLQASIVQIGKALNDPIRGVTALRKVGVSFTQQQLEQIRVLQQSGDLLGAQKIVLAELKSEFGGAAQAMATPLTQVKNAISNVAEELGMALLPTLRSLSKVITGNIGIVTGLAKGIFIAVAAFAAVKIATIAYTAYTKAAAVSAILFQAVVNPLSLAKVAFGIAGAGVAILALNQEIDAATGTAAAAVAKFQSMGDASDEMGANVTMASSALQKIQGDITKVIAALTDMQGQMDVDPAVFRRMVVNKGLVGELDKLTTFDGATTQAQKLREILDQIPNLRDILGADKTLEVTKRLTDEIGRASGATSQVADAQREIDLATGRKSEIDIATEKAAAAGALTEQVAELRSKLQELESVKQGKQFAEDAKRAREALQAEGKTISDSLRTPTEKIEAQVAHLRRINSAGGIDDDTYRRGLQQAQKDLKPKQLGEAPSLSGMGGVGAASQQALNAIVAASRKDGAVPIQEQQKRLLERIAEYLSKIEQKTAKSEEEVYKL